MTTLEKIIKRAQKGDSEALTTLYKMYVERIYRYIFYRVTLETDAEDLTAEVFVKMVESLPSYKYTGAPFESWLYRIASARVIDFRRRHKIRNHDELPETLSDERPSMEENLQERDEVKQLREALAQLTQEQQQILVLRFIERKSHSDVAAIIGKSESAVKSIQHRALHKLAELLGSPEKARHYLRGQS